MTEGLPRLSVIRELEKRTLKLMAELGPFGQLGGLQAEAKAAYGSINEHKGPVDVHLGFILDIRLRADKRRSVAYRRVDIGALVRPTRDDRAISNASYSVTICKTDKPATSPILRKVHFDYEPIAGRNVTEPKPTIHMQVCGKLSSQLLNAGYKDSKLTALYPGFEKPRIPVAPTSIALIVNWLLLEFQSDAAGQAVLRDPQWRKLVAGAERTVLAPYYKTATNFLTAAKHVSDGFLQTCLYEASVG